MTRHRLALWAEVVAALATVSAVVLTVLRARPAERLDASVLAVALAWGASGIAADLLCRRRRGRVDEAPVVGATRSVTAVVRLGDVPDEIARTTTAAAAAVGPVVLLTGDRPPPAGLSPDVRVVGPDGADQLGRALAGIDTHAVLLTSARALPRADTCRAAAAQLSERVGWVVGRCEPLNVDRFGSDRRERVDSALRRRPGTPWLWEPDATVVRTDLLRDHPPAPGRPMGAWLRDRAVQGVCGARTDEVLALRAAPVSGSGYWPDTTARQRAAAADLSDAVWRSGASLRARAQATALLGRALSGWSVLWWLAALVLARDGLPVEVDPGAFGVVVVVAITSRWVALRSSVGVKPRPVLDAASALYAVPGSLASTGAALSRRVRPSRIPLPTRPLVWIALMATAAAACVLVTSDPGGDTSRLAAVAAVGLLVLLWIFTVRSLVEKDWERTGFRVPLDLPASVPAPAPGRSGRSHEAPAIRGRLVDGSPGGFAFSGPPSGFRPGDEIEVSAVLGADLKVELVGTVAALRHNRGGEVLGVELRSVRWAGPSSGQGRSSAASAWASTLVDASRDARPLAEDRVVPEHTDGFGRAGRLLDRIVLSAVVLTSLVVVAALALLLIGFRPLVIRSGSMEPTYSSGDLVLVESRRAGDLRAGEVVTRFHAPEAADSLTHRVLAVRKSGGQGAEGVRSAEVSVTVETRGDANDSSEIWTVPASTEVGVVVAHVPWIGRPAALVRTSTGWALVAGAGLVIVVAAVVLPRGRSRNAQVDPDPRARRSEPVG